MLNSGHAVLAREKSGSKMDERVSLSGMASKPKPGVLIAGNCNDDGDGIMVNDMKMRCDEQPLIAIINRVLRARDHETRAANHAGRAVKESESVESLCRW